MKSTHLTRKQVLQFIDGTLDYASQAQCTNHLALCSRCRKEVELQKAITRVSHRQPVVRTSSGFARRVMTGIMPRPEQTWRSRLVDNLGNVFAMAMVLAVLGYAVTNPSLFKVQEQATQESFIPSAVSNVYAKVLQTFSEKTQEATQQVTRSTGNQSDKIISLTVLSLCILVFLDQFVLKRYMTMRIKN